MNSFFGHCSICGHRGEFSFEAGVAVRENYRCSSCRATTRYRDVAQLIIDEFGDGVFLDLKRFAASGEMDSMDIYEVGMTGPIAARLTKLPRYVQSYYWEDLSPGELRNGIQCQDLRALTFEDARFDLIISLDVLEHVFRVDDALREISRVLKPGGVHVFSIPVVYPLPEKSTVRARPTPDGIEYILPPRFHNAGDGSKCIVVTDWGRDFIELHKEVGLRLSIVRRSSPNVDGFQNATFIARRLSLT